MVPFNSYTEQELKMGMDIFFQAFDAAGRPLGDRQELRCREVYHAVNDWCDQQEQPTPANGERVRFSAAQWLKFSPRVCEAIAQTELDISKGTAEAAMALGRDWLERIAPPGTAHVEYWFTN